MLGAVLAMALLVALAMPASGAGAVPSTISGTSVPSDCNGAEGAGALELSGDLTGCLVFFPKNYTCAELNGFAYYEERGTEIFRGSYKGARGTFRTFYEVSATYESGSCAEFDAGRFPFAAQLTGGCDHAITGKRGAFQGLDGNLNFFDVIPDPGTSGASHFLYAGYLK